MKPHWINESGRDKGSIFVCSECEHYDSEKHYCPRFCQVIKDALSEAQPKKGKWIFGESLDGASCYMCSNCYEIEYVNYYDYCPNCGAKMEEE